MTSSRELPRCWPRHLLADRFGGREAEDRSVGGWVAALDVLDLALPELLVVRDVLAGQLLPDRSRPVRHERAVGQELVHGPKRPGHVDAEQRREDRLGDGF